MIPRITRIPLRVIPVVVALALLAVPAVTSGSPAGADDLGTKQAQAAQVADKLDALQQKLIELDSQFETAKADLAHAADAVQAAQTQSDEAQAELGRIEAELRTFSVQAYVTGNDSPAFDALVTSNGNDAPQKKGYIEIASGSRRDLLDRYQATKAKADADAEVLAQAQADAEARSKALEKSQGDAEAAVSEQTKIKSQVDGELATLVAQEEQRRAEEAARKAREQAALQVTRTASTPAQTSPTTPSAQAPSPAGSTTSPPATGAPPPPPSPDPPPPPAPGPRGGGAGAVSAAMSRIGSPYVWAAAGPNAFDCSGLTMWAWAQVGVSLPHYSGAQYSMSRRISISDALPGDLIFFWAPGAGGEPSHVGLYIGGGSMVHAPSAGNYVRVDSIYWWTGARIAAGRI